MRVSSALRVSGLAVVVALLTNAPFASAKPMHHRPPGACVFHHKLIANGSVCVSHCIPNSLGCEQVSCQSGHLVEWLGCVRPFCFPACG